MANPSQHWFSGSNDFVRNSTMRGVSTAYHHSSCSVRDPSHETTERERSPPPSYLDAVRTSAHTSLHSANLAEPSEARASKISTARSQVSDPSTSLPPENTSRRNFRGRIVLIQKAPPHRPNVTGTTFPVPIDEHGHSHTAGKVRRVLVKRKFKNSDNRKAPVEPSKLQKPHPASVKAPCRH